AALLAGCSAVAGAPRNIANSWSDDERREHTVARIGEGIVGAGAALLAYEWCQRRSGRVWVGVLCGIIAGPLAEYLVLVFLLEPAGVTGFNFGGGSLRP